MKNKKMDPNEVSAENPETFTGIRRHTPPTKAGGLPAVWSSLKHVFGAMDVPRGLKALGKLNKKTATIVPDAPGPTRMTNVRE